MAVLNIGDSLFHIKYLRWHFYFIRDVSKTLTTCLASIIHIRYDPTYKNNILQGLIMMNIKPIFISAPQIKTIIQQWVVTDRIKML